MEEINKLIEEKCELLGFKLVELIFNDKFKKIMIVIYKPTGVAVDDCEKLTRELLDDIEFNECFRNEYDLEVSSPGVDRIFKSKKEYDIFAGKEVKIIKEAIDGKSEIITGVLKGNDDENNILVENEYNLYKIAYGKIKKGGLLFDKF